MLALHNPPVVRLFGTQKTTKTKLVCIQTSPKRFRTSSRNIHSETRRSFPSNSTDRATSRRFLLVNGMTDNKRGIFFLPSSDGEWRRRQLDYCITVFRPMGADDAPPRLRPQLPLICTTRLFPLTPFLYLQYK